MNLPSRSLCSGDELIPKKGAKMIYLLCLPLLVIAVYRSVVERNLMVLLQGGIPLGLLVKSVAHAPLGWLGDACLLVGGIALIYRFYPPRGNKTGGQIS
jgi:hypothetical protein